MRFVNSIVLRCATIVALGLFAATACSVQEPAHAPEQPAEGAAQTTQDGHGGAAAGDEKLNPMVVDPDLAIFTAIIFLLLLGVLRLFAWPQISAALLEREKRIEEQIAAATAKHEEAKQLVAEHEARLAATAGEVRALLEEAKRDADHTRRQGEAEGRKAKEDELVRALREIERAKHGAIQELAKASANVAVEMASKVVGERISPDEHALLVRRAMGELTTIASSKN
jgi:F-type H+-transporting ATPase subunit b